MKGHMQEFCGGRSRIPWAGGFSKNWKWLVKIGDLVRFAKWEEVDIRDSRTWPEEPKPYIGILVEHDKLLGYASVLHEGVIHKVRQVFAEKAGKRDFENHEQSTTTQ